jgi:hypothetical protein
MNEYDYDPKEIDKAKKMAVGSLGKKTAKIPLLFASAIYFGNDKSVSGPAINNATVTLVKGKNDYFAITCFHLLDGYIKKLQENPNLSFYIGKKKMNPIKNIIDKNERLDLITFKVNEDVLFKNNDEGISSYFYTPLNWPPENVSKSDFVHLGGFPGKIRELRSPELIVNGFTVSGSPVSSVSDDYFYCKFERENWIKSINRESFDTRYFKELGGMSGGPVFVQRGSPINYFELVGIIKEFSPEYDLLYIRSIKFINNDGKISQH